MYTLSLLVADGQGSVKKGIGAVIEPRDIAVPPDEHHRRVGQGVCSFDFYFKTALCIYGEYA
jgi:hypothetical protein